MDGLFFLEVTLAGLGSGGLYALAALAFVIVYKATRVVNIAIGEFLMMGAYAFYASPPAWIGRSGWPSPARWRPRACWARWSSA